MYKKEKEKIKQFMIKYTFTKCNSDRFRETCDLGYNTPNLKVMIPKENRVNNAASNGPEWIKNKHAHTTAQRYLNKSTFPCLSRISR